MIEYVSTTTTKLCIRYIDLLLCGLFEDPEERYTCDGQMKSFWRQKKNKTLLQVSPKLLHNQVLWQISARIESKVLGTLDDLPKLVMDISRWSAQSSRPHRSIMPCLLKKIIVIFSDKTKVKSLG